MKSTIRQSNLILIVRIISILGGIVGHDVDLDNVQALASFDFTDCFTDSDECFRNGGPHMVLSYDTANFEPRSMTARLILDGSILLETANPSGDIGIILTSPHEKPLDVS